MRDLIAPLRSPVYRNLWLASLVSNLGTLMQAVAVAWVMTSLSLSPLVVSLVPVAALSPVFVFGLPGGVLADVVNRRHFLLGTQAWMMLCAAAMGVLVLADAATPTSLLLLTFGLGVGNALNLPAWQSLVQDLVPREHVAAAVALNSISFNTGRVVGPVIGGLLVGWIGAPMVFFLNSSSFLGTVLVLALWKGGAAVDPGRSLWPALAEGVGYVRRAVHLHSPLTRLAGFAFGASAPLAVLPLLAREGLGLTAPEYGYLLGFFGAGSLLAGMAVPPLRRLVGASAVVSGASGVMAGGMALLGSSGSFMPAAVALLICGFAWVSCLVNLNVAVQMSASQALRGRTMSIYLGIFQGSFALGSLAAGATAKLTGIPAALWIFATASGVAAWLTARHRLPEAEATR
jgi:MFS family permease